MSIRTIKQAGAVVGYQALAGAGEAGRSKYFAVAKHGGQDKALMAAQAHSAMLHATCLAYPRPAMRGNVKGIPGVRLVWSPSRCDDPPILHAAASWNKDGKQFGRSYSTNKHGGPGALALAMRAREKALGSTYNISPTELWERLCPLYNQSSSIKLRSL